MPKQYFVSLSKTKGILLLLLLTSSCSSNYMERINLMKSFYLGRSSRRRGKQLELPPGWRGFTCWRSSLKFGWQFWKMDNNEKVTEIEMVGGKVRQTKTIWQNRIISCMFKPLRNSFLFASSSLLFSQVTKCPINGIDYWPFFFHSNQF